MNQREDGHRGFRIATVLLNPSEFSMLDIHHILQRAARIIQKNDWEILLSRLFRPPKMTSIPRMQRLFSMFPSGMAGVGLLTLRVCSAAVLLVDCPAHPLEDRSIWLLIFFITMSGTLCVGLFTPYAAAIGCLIELTAAWNADPHTAFHFIVAALNITAVGLLGPGAYSFDARLFGRRRIRFSAGGKSTDRP
jgi:hypothetical protein